MERFTTLTAVAAPLPRDNIDTDVIISAEFIGRLGTDMSRIGDGAFRDWRFDADGSPRPDFVLNRPEFEAAKILVTGANFGCGSSREHAVWALMGRGLRCVIARSFGDIFFNNCLKQGLLPIALDAAPHARVMRWVTDAAGTGAMTVDLEQRQLLLAAGETVPFDIDSEHRQRLLLGLDEIGLTLQHEAEIDAFQRRDRERRPWVWRVDFNYDPDA